MLQRVKDNYNFPVAGFTSDIYTSLSQK